ncbi:MAG: hypothetical protein ACRDVE_15290 [Actinocrinis sp.]
MGDPGIVCILDGDPYMTVAEFAALPSDLHHAVWLAAAQGRMEFLDAGPGSTRRYRRAQVLALLAGTAETRG